MSMSTAIAASTVTMRGESSTSNAAETVRSRMRLAMPRASHCRAALPGGGVLLRLRCLRLLGPTGHPPTAGNARSPDSAGAPDRHTCERGCRQFGTLRRNFSSARTVEYHLAKVFRKLRISSRAPARGSPRKPQISGPKKHKPAACSPLLKTGDWGIYRCEAIGLFGKVASGESATEKGGSVAKDNVVQA